MMIMSCFVMTLVMAMRTGDKIAGVQAADAIIEIGKE